LTNEIIEQMMKDRNTPVYAFFSPIPDIEYVDQHRCHVVKCLARGCSHKIRRFLDKGDKTSTGNMRKHVRLCWGENVMKTICSAKDLAAARNGITEYTDKGSITASFEQKGKGKVYYRHRQHTHTETRAEIVCWVAENLRPFEIVKDHGFQSLMKTGRPEYYIPHPTTVSHDTRLVFANVRKHIAKILRVSLLVICMQWLFDFTYQEYEGELSFAMDAWTSPNHKSFVAVTVHLTREDKPLVMVLNIVKVAKV
jgi:hypothetical protein